MRRLNQEDASWSKAAPSRSEKPSLLERPLVLLTQGCVRFPKSVLTFALVAAAICLYLTWSGLTFKTSRLDLINPKSEFNQRWLDYLADFGDNDDLIVVVEGDSIELLPPVLDELAASIREKPHLFCSVLESVDTTPFVRKGLYFMDEEGLDAIFPLVQLGLPLSQGHGELLSPVSYLGFLLNSLQQRLTHPESPSAWNTPSPGALRADLNQNAPPQNFLPQNFTQQNAPSQNFTQQNALPLDASSRENSPVQLQGSQAAFDNSNWPGKNNDGENWSNSNVVNGNTVFGNMPNESVFNGNATNASSSIYHELDLFVTSLGEVFQIPVDTLSRLDADATRPQPNTSGILADSTGTLAKSPRMLSGSDEVSAPRLFSSPLPPIPPLASKQKEYFLNESGTLGVILLRINESKEGSFTYGTESISQLRQLIQRCQERHPEVQIGLTGLTIMENDEMRMSQDASTKAGILSFLGVAIAFLAAFGGIRHSLMAIATLAIGFAWTMGYVVESVGHLNILSMSFGVILIGLGIDFSIHYLAKYIDCRKTTRSPEQAILLTARQTGPGILLGALTTASAFVLLGTTEFTGIVELGIICAGGIFLCCMAAIVVLPALIQIMDGRHPLKPLPVLVNIHAWIQPVFHYPKTVLLLCLLATAYLATGLPKLWYDHNLLNLQPENLESVRWEEKLLNQWDKSAWFAISLADSPTELLERKREFEKNPDLIVEEIFSQFPKITSEKQEKISKIAVALSMLPTQLRPLPSVSAVELDALLQKTIFLLSSTSDPGKNPSYGNETLTEDQQKEEIQRRIAQIRLAMSQASEQELQQRLTLFQQTLANEIFQRLWIVRTCSDTAAPSLTDLPEALVERYVGTKRGTPRYLMRIYCAHEIWAMPVLKKFVADVKKVDPKVTGNPIQTYEASLQMERSYQKAAVGAFFVILCLTYFDFRSIVDTLLVFLPLSLGAIQCFGLLGLLGIPLNPANAIVIPLILGIGIDDGVHLIHHFRQQRGPYQMPASLACSIVLTTLTTIIGFGTLMIADHRGLQSLGRVLVIGISTCTFSSLIMMAALLTWATAKRRQ